jgi:hypothetical protein
MSTGIQLRKDESHSRLVYRVNPLPESMIPSIWDYKSLNEVDEGRYIEKMVSKTFESSSLLGKAFSLVNLWLIPMEKNNELMKIKAI